MKLQSPSPLRFGYNKSYHDQLHKNLLTKKQYKTYANQMIAADNFALQFEDEINRLEHEKKTNTNTYFDLADLLVEIKTSIALYLSMYFPKEKYCENLINDYEKEIDAKKSQNAKVWREKLCMNLDKLIPNNIEENLSNQQNENEIPSALDMFEIQIVKTRSQGEFSDIRQIRPEETEETGQMEQMGQIEQMGQGQQSKDRKAPKGSILDRFSALLRQDDDSALESASDILVKFEPNSTSPKGFCDVVGMDELKEQLNDEIICYIKDPSLAELDKNEYGIDNPRGFLFYGPPGCGKTYLVEALGGESGLDLYKMDISKIGSKYINETSTNIQKAFDALCKIAKENNKPVLLFMDEADSLAISRGFNQDQNTENSKATTTMLKVIEKARDQGIIPIAATNKYDNLDEAFIARFDSQKYIGLPDKTQIIALLKNSLSKRTKGQTLAQNEEELEKLARQLLGYSNRTIVFIVDAAAKSARRNKRSEITSDEILKALNEADFAKSDESEYKKESDKKRSAGFI